jgi:hypothetical protein
MNDNPYKSPQETSGPQTLRPLLATAGYSVLGLSAVPVGFLGIGSLCSVSYALVKVFLAYQKLPPHEPALFALALVGATVFFMISVLALLQEHRTNRSLLALWCGSVVGVALYGVAAILKLQGHF